MTKNVSIFQPSVMSLLLRMRRSGTPLSVGTGFVVQAPAGPVLITNWHNVAGRRPDTDEPLSPTGALPDEVEIIHNKKDALGAWVSRVESLYSAGGVLRWREHPSLGKQLDVVALPLSSLDDVGLYPYALGDQPKIACRPADSVSVVGFPFGMQAGGSLAVWATGFLASEPDIDFNGLPVFLVDCRTRQGQSGSAVIAFRRGGAVAMEDGSTAIMGGPVWRFLGVYSGRVNSESDIGLVWKVAAVEELVASVT